MTRKWRVLITVVSIFTVLLLAGCNATEAETVAVPEGAAGGDLTELEPCEFQAGNETYDAECGVLVARARWEDPDSRRLQESDVDMLVINGDLDFSTPPNAIAEARPYWREAQFVLLPGFGHIDDVQTLQPAAFARLISSYYGSGLADDSSFTLQPLRFNPGMRLPLMASCWPRPL